MAILSVGIDRDYFMRTDNYIENTVRLFVNLTKTNNACRSAASKYVTTRLENEPNILVSNIRYFGQASGRIFANGYSAKSLLVSSLIKTIYMYYDNLIALFQYT